MNLFHINFCMQYILNIFFSQPLMLLRTSPLLSPPTYFFLKIPFYRWRKRNSEASSHILRPIFHPGSDNQEFDVLKLSCVLSQLQEWCWKQTSFRSLSWVRDLDFRANSHCTVLIQHWQNVLLRTWLLGEVAHSFKHMLQFNIEWIALMVHSVWAPHALHGEWDFQVRLSDSSEGWRQ